MPISSFVYEAPVRRRVRTPVLDYHLLEAGFALAEQGRVQEAVAQVLAHLFPGRAIPDLTREPFTFTQGSSCVKVQVQGERLSVTVPLVRLPVGGGTVAALRYLLTKISGSGQLHQPRLRGDEVFLEFSDLLSRMHPAKLLEVLRRMPLEADSADDWLIGQFAAQPLLRATIHPLAPEELTRAAAIWRTHWEEIEDLLKESQRKRSMFFLNELTAYALYRLRVALPMCGFLAARLDEAFSTFNDGDVDPLKREAALAKCAREMKAVSLEELERNLGHAEYAISPQQEGKAETLTGYFQSGDYLKSIDKLRSTGKSLDAALALVSTYAYLLGRFAWPEPIATELEAGLAKVSGLPWREAASTLFAHTEALLERYDEDGRGDAAGGGADGADDGTGEGDGGDEPSDDIDDDDDDREEDAP